MSTPSPTERTTRDYIRLIITGIYFLLLIAIGGICIIVAVFDLFEELGLDATSRLLKLILFVVSSIAVSVVLDRFVYFDEVFGTLKQRSTESKRDIEELKRENSKMVQEILTSREDIMQAITDSQTVWSLGSRGRSRAKSIYAESFHQATEHIDIMALTSQYFTEHYGDVLIEKIRLTHCNIRILLLDPQSPMWVYRAKDEGGNVEDYVRIVKKVLAFYDNIKEKLDGCRCQGSLTVKLHDRIPYRAYYCADEVAVFGFYNSHIFGVDSHAVQVAYGSELYNELRDNFTAVWGDAQVHVRIDPFQ
ncbi:MAG: hypothetical protein JXA10_18945 [Anaerolineae bacterium]|nr:hypothetical protein [Anaerolineae bacterium]